VSNTVIDLDPTDHITIDTFGASEEGTFVLQGQAGECLIALTLDSDQLLGLSIAGNELLDILDEEYPRELNLLQIPPPERLALRLPIDPLFAIAQFQLGYDAGRDALLIIVIELPADLDLEQTEFAVVRFWISREQMVALLRQMDQVLGVTLRICPGCGQPIEAREHRCLRNN
jgi:uncharacterized repeat protein (TIGR03847 family)